MPYNTRHAGQRKRPKRFDDFDESSSPVTSSPNENLVGNSRKSPRIEQPSFPSPPQRKTRGRRDKYEGPVIEYNWKLPPAAFPTVGVNEPSPTHRSDREDFEPVSSDTDEQVLTVDPTFSGRCHDNIHDPSHTMFSVPKNQGKSVPRGDQKSSITVNRSMTANAAYNSSGAGLGLTDNGPNNPIYTRNLKIMGDMGQRTDFDWAMEEMKTSDEDEKDDDDGDDEPPAKVAKKPQSPSWDDLTIAMKLELADAVNEQKPGREPQVIMELLLLNALQQDELTRLLIERQQRETEADAHAKLLKEHTREVLLKGGKINQEEFHNMAQRTIYRSAGEDDHTTATAAEYHKARGYLMYCGFDPSIIDWAPPISGSLNTQKVQEPTLRASKSTDTSSDSESTDSLPQRRTGSRVSFLQQEANSALPVPNEAQNKNSRTGFPSRRQPTTLELINAHSSPAAPHTVPARPFPIVPVASMLSQTGNGYLEKSYRSSQYRHRGESSLQAESMPPPHTRNPYSQLPTPPGDSSSPPDTNGPAARLQAQREKKTRKDAAGHSVQVPATSYQGTSSNSGGVTNKRKRVSGGGDGNGASGSETGAGGAVDYPWAASLRSSTQKMKRAGAGQK